MNFEHLSDPAEHRYGRVLLAAFDGADVARIDIGTMGERLLREPEARSLGPDLLVDVSFTRALGPPQQSSGPTTHQAVHEPVAAVYGARP